MNKAIIIFVGGLIAGLTAGVLFAPESGADTRERISRKTRDTLDGLLQKIEDGAEMLRGMKNDLDKKASDAANALND